MKIKLTILLLGFSLTAFCQTTLDEEFQKADSLFDAHDYNGAYKIFKELHSKCDRRDTLYNYILWSYISTTAMLENSYSKKEDFKSSLDYGLKALDLINKGKKIFNEQLAGRDFWMTKNIVVSYFGLGKLDSAKIYQDVLYRAYKEKKLPKGLDKCYNFEYFKFDNKNIWGYEWYPELGDPETEGSFSKMVYYVYSTNSDGSDKDQLYRLHVLKFHKLDESIKIDYVLTKRLETATSEKSGTLYSYTYTRPLSYKKISEDIRKVLKGEY